jgi:hypothetical protein
VRTIDERRPGGVRKLYLLAVRAVSLGEDHDLVGLDCCLSDFFRRGCGSSKIAGDLVGSSEVSTESQGKNRYHGGSKQDDSNVRSHPLQILMHSLR